MASRDEATHSVPLTSDSASQHNPHATSTKPAHDTIESTSPAEAPTSDNDPPSAATNTRTTTLSSPVEMSQLDYPTSPTTPGLNDRFISASSSLTNLQETQASGGATAAGANGTLSGTNDGAASHTPDGQQSSQSENHGATTTVGNAPNTTTNTTQHASGPSPNHATSQPDSTALRASTAEDPEDTLSSTAQPPVRRPSRSQRQQSSAGIGPSEDNPHIVPDPSVEGPAVLITLLLTTGARHPYRIDKKYLRKRMIFEEGDEPPDPFEISIYAVKELIWRDWRDGEFLRFLFFWKGELLLRIRC